jgi:hypothetical protein
LRWEHTNLAVTRRFVQVKKFQTNLVLSAGFQKKLEKWFTKVNQATSETGSPNKSETKCLTLEEIMKLNTRLRMGAVPRTPVVKTNERKSQNTNRDSTKAQAVKVAEQMAAAVEDRTADNELGINYAV